MSKITAQVEVIVKPIMEDLNFELVDVVYVKEGRDHFLRISIDKEGGVDLND
ncbi:ribosome maturation factor RimP, partial [Staphylococcus aureus]|nr:ribosome maturation factor RimP [Staphylococcus aureus]